MTDQKRLDWQTLLEQAVNEPGKVSEAYRRFHGYSLGNQWWAMLQCGARGLEVGPIASFNRWKELGRHVKKGEKALSLCMPIVGKKKDAEGNRTDETYQFFVLKNNWFVLSQTEGDEYKAAEIPEWNEERALSVLAISKIPFDLMNGNAQGYAAPGSKVSVSPLATHPHKTLFHELGHQVLGHVGTTDLSDGETTPRNIQEVEAECVAMLCCASLGLAGVEYSRGYIQSWIEGASISDKSAQKIFSAADKILKAGEVQ